MNVFLVFLACVLIIFLIEVWDNLLAVAGVFVYVVSFVLGMFALRLVFGFFLGHGL
jgi:hypothetical protein